MDVPKPAMETCSSGSEDSFIAELDFDAATNDAMKVIFLREKLAKEHDQRKEAERKLDLLHNKFEAEVTYQKVLQEEIERERGNVKQVLKGMGDMEDFLKEDIEKLKKKLSELEEERVELLDSLENHKILMLEQMHKGKKDMSVVPMLKQEIKELRQTGLQQRKVVEALEKENKVLKRALDAANKISVTGEQTLNAYMEETSSYLHEEVLALRKDLHRKQQEVDNWHHKYENAIKKHDAMRKIIWDQGLNPGYTGDQFTMKARSKNRQQQQHLDSETWLPSILEGEKSMQSTAVSQNYYKSRKDGMRSSQSASSYLSAQSSPSTPFSRMSQNNSSKKTTSARNKKRQKWQKF